MEAPLVERLYGHLTDDTAQNDLLEKSGYSVPKVDYGDVLYDPGELRAVEPVPRFPGNPTPASATQDVQELRQVLADHGATERAMFEQIMQLRVELQALKSK
jgi:hypothetical protein